MPFFFFFNFAFFIFLIHALSLSVFMTSGVGVMILQDILNVSTLFLHSYSFPVIGVFSFLHHRFL